MVCLCERLQAGQITMAADVFEAMKSRGIKPSPTTAGTMLLIYKSKDVDPRYLLVFHAAIVDRLKSGMILSVAHAPKTNRLSLFSGVEN